MEEITWLISKEKRERFNQEYEKLITEIPREFVNDFDYMPYWCSEFLFPSFNRIFIEQLPNNYRQDINNLYEKVINTK